MVANIAGACRLPAELAPGGALLCLCDTPFDLTGLTLHAAAASSPLPLSSLCVAAGKDMQIEVDSRGQEVTPTPPLPSCLTRGGATGQPGALYWRFF